MPPKLLYYQIFKNFLVNFNAFINAILIKFYLCEKLVYKSIYKTHQ